MDRAALNAALRARSARLDRNGGAVHAGGEGVPLCAVVDGGLPGGGGLARAALHEVLAADVEAAAGFCALVLARARGTGPGTVLWIAPGAEDPLPDRSLFGLSPADLVLVRAPWAEDGLWAMEEGLRCPGVAGAVLVAPAAVDAAAARRLQVAAESGGGLGLLLRPEAAEAEGGGGPTAALTRWRVAALAGGTGGGTAQGLGDPRWRLDLLRSRGGRPRSWQVVWRPAAERLELDDAERPGLEDAGTAGTTALPPPRRARRPAR